MNNSSYASLPTEHNRFGTDISNRFDQGVEVELVMTTIALIVGNAFVIAVVKQKGNRSINDLFIVNLSISDILFVAVSLLRLIFMAIYPDLPGYLKPRSDPSPPWLSV